LILRSWCRARHRVRPATTTDAPSNQYLGDDSYPTGISDPTRPEPSRRSDKNAPIVTPTTDLRLHPPVTTSPTKPAMGPDRHELEPGHTREDLEQERDAGSDVLRGGGDRVEPHEEHTIARGSCAHTVLQRGCRRTWGRGRVHSGQCWYGPPNGVRLSCGAKLEHSQTEFYNT
jgi:hypothetical protein